METNTTPLFDPATHELLREPTAKEKDLADQKAALIKIFRDPGMPIEDRAEAKALLEAMAASAGKAQVWDLILTGKDTLREADLADAAELAPAAEAPVDPNALKKMLVFDSKHPRNPPAGKVKAMVVTEHHGRNYFVAVNIHPGSTKIPKYCTAEYGQVVAGPVELQDSEWKDA